MISFIKQVRAGIQERGEYRLGSYDSFWSRFALSRWSWSVALCLFEDHWSLHLFCLWVRLWTARRQPHDMIEKWGFDWQPLDGRYLQLSWGRRHKFIYMPWATQWVSTEHGMPDGSFVTVERVGRLPSWVVGNHRTVLYRRPGGKLVRPGSDGLGRLMDKDFEIVAGRYKQTFDYTYFLNNGTWQERQATVTVERRTWTWRVFWLFGLFWPCWRRTNIWVELSDEVGERSGGWKGGVIGCGWDMRRGETPEQCLRRMEQERKFN